MHSGFRDFDVDVHGLFFRVELLVMNLAQDIDVEEYETEIRQFQEVHAEQIERNRKRCKYNKYTYFTNFMYHGLIAHLHLIICLLFYQYWSFSFIWSFFKIFFYIADLIPTSFGFSSSWKKNETWNSAWPKSPSRQMSVRVFLFISLFNWSGRWCSV